MFDYAERRRRLAERLESAGVAALFLAPSADLEYLTGVERHIPSFGEASYAHGWVTGASSARAPSRCSSCRACSPHSTSVNGLKAS